MAVAAALCAVVAPLQSAHADPTVIGWTAKADANVVDYVLDNSSGLAGAHPVSEGDIPEDFADFETGPFGHGLASVAWPGGTAGNFGSLSAQLGFPSQLMPITSKTNDPIRAETFYPAGPTSATYPAGAPGTAGQMQSAATSKGVTASSSAAFARVPSLFDIRDLAGSSAATASSRAEAKASGSFSSLSLLGGLVEVGASTFSARATSDGSQPEGSQVTDIGTITVAGHAVTVGSKGIVVASSTNNLLGPLLTQAQDDVNQVVSAVDLKIATLPSTQTRSGPAEKITSGGLRITITMPTAAGSINPNCSFLPAQMAQLKILCTLPSELSGATFTVTLGRTTATAIAAAPFASHSAALPPSAPPATSPPGSTPPSVAAVSPVTVVGRATSLPVAVAPSSKPAGAAPVASPTTDSISASSPVKAGVVISLLMGAGLAAAGLVRTTRRLARMIA